MAGISSVLLAGGGTLDQVLQRAIACHAGGQLQEAIDLYRAVLHEVPTQPDANHNLGVIHVQANAVSESFPYLLAAIESAPTVPQYWLSFIEALAMAGRIGEARQTLELARQHGLQGANADNLAARLADVSSEN